jgi:hypothetical protein
VKAGKYGDPFTHAGPGSAGASACAERKTAGSRSRIAKAVIIVTAWHEEAVKKSISHR